MLDRYGYLGKGNRRVCPARVVKVVRHHYPFSNWCVYGTGSCLLLLSFVAKMKTCLLLITSFIKVFSIILIIVVSVRDQ